MATELIKYEQSETQPSVYSNANLYEIAFKMAESLSKSDLIPDTYKNKPENCLIAIDTARQIGARSPIFVMQNLYIVKGKPSWSGQYCSAIVYANFKDVVVNRVGNKETGMTACYITAIDKNGHDCKGSTISIEMAKAEGWWSKKDKYGKETSKWQTMPEQMMIYRAFAFFARAYCPDKLLGMPDVYEADDIYTEPSKASKAKELEKELSRVIDVEPITESEEK